MSEKIFVKSEIEIPDGATHYYGNINDNPTFMKCKNIGCVGKHWFYYDVDKMDWIFHCYGEVGSFVQSLDKIKIEVNTK